MKTTVGKVAKAFAAIDAAKTTKLESTERQSVVKIWFALKDIAQGYIDLETKSRKDLQPEGFADLASKGQFTPAELVELNRMNQEYSRALEAVLQPESDKEVEVEIPVKLSVDVALKLIESNDWPTSKLGDLGIVINK